MTPFVANLAPDGLVLMSALGAVAVGIAALIKAYSVLRKVELDAGGSMRGDLLARITLLESRIGDLESQLNREQARHAGEIQVLRHELGNESASLDAFILLAEANPDKVLQALPRIKEMRERRKIRIATEKGAMAGANMAGTG